LAYCEAGGPGRYGTRTLIERKRERERERERERAHGLHPSPLLLDQW